MWSAQRNQLIRSTTVFALAAVLALVYTRLAGFRGEVNFSPLGASLHGGLRQLSPVLRDAIGDFGGLTVPLPRPLVWIWWALVAGLVGGAVAFGPRRERWLTGLATVLALAFPVLFYAWIGRQTGYGLQGREVLPPLLLIPLLAGEVVYRTRAVRIPHSTTRLSLPIAGIVAAIAFMQAYAWWYSSRVAAGAPGTLRFWDHATWNPPLGWGLWIGLVVAGTVALLAFAGSEVLGDVRGSPVEDDEAKRKYAGDDSERRQQSDAPA
jgi:hypothetical protein